MGISRIAGVGGAVEVVLMSGGANQSRSRLGKRAIMDNELVGISRIASTGGDSVDV